MGSESERIKNDIENKRNDIMRTAMEIGDRVAVPRTTFFAGMMTGILLLAMLNRVQFRRWKQ